MKYNHAVKYKGEFYPTGADVPVEDIKDDINVNTDGEDKTDDKVADCGESNIVPNAEPNLNAKAEADPNAEAKTETDVKVDSETDPDAKAETEKKKVK